MVRRKKTKIGYWVAGVLLMAILMNSVRPPVKQGLVEGEHDSCDPQATHGPNVCPSGSTSQTQSTTTKEPSAAPSAQATATPTPVPTATPTPTEVPTPTPTEEVSNISSEGSGQTTTQPQSSGIIQNVQNFIFGRPQTTTQPVSQPTVGVRAPVTTKVVIKPTPTPTPTETFKAELVKTQLELTTEKIGNLKKVGLTVPGLAGTIDEIITEHNDFSEKVDAEVVKINSRPKFIKWLLGPDFRALRALNQLIATNSGEIKRLQDLLFKVSDPNDIDSIKAAVQAIQQENQAIQDQITAESNLPSVFGFVMQWVAR